MQTRYLSGVFKGGRERVWRAVLTSGTVDADRDRINVSGVVLTRFLANPVCLLQHEARSFPIGRWENVKRIGQGYSGRLEAELHMVGPGVLKEADTAAELITSKILNAVSIGFLPLEPGEPNKWGGYDFARVELLEASVVTVGSNPDALLAAGLGGKRPEPVVYLAPSEKRYTVNPAMVAKAVREAVASAARKALCEAGGRLSDTEADLEAVLSKARLHAGAGAVSGLQLVLGGAVEPPESRSLAPDELRPIAPPATKLPPVLDIPHRILREVGAA